MQQSSNTMARSVCTQGKEHRQQLSQDSGEIL